MLATRLQPKVARYLEQVPQWAYLPSRSTGDALKAVCAHMNQVRTLLATHSTSLPNRFQGAPQPKMHGGISISLDVMKAFDSLKHDFLEAMREAQFNEDEIQTIRFLHSQACLYALPPSPEVPPSQEDEQQSKFCRPNGKGPDQGAGKGLSAPRSHRANLPTATPTSSMPAPQQRRQFQPQTPANRPRASEPSAPSNSLASGGLVTKVAQLLLPHEDYLNGLAQGTTWVMFQGTSPPLSIIPAQARISEQWQITKTERPSSIRHPLRTVLFQTWASELKARVESLDTDPDKKQEAIRLGALEEPNNFHYKKWNPALRALETITTVAPLTAREVISLLEEIIVLSTEENSYILFFRPSHAAGASRA
eukprot:s7930_g2.t1